MLTSIEATIPAARKLGKINGKAVSRFTVMASLNNSRTFTADIRRFVVIAHTAADAANLIRDQFATRPETEIVTRGTRGGITERFVGWETAIGNAMWQRPSAQAELPLAAPSAAQ